MQYTAILLLLSACLSLGSSQCIDTFEPGCRSQSELGNAYRHCIDPTKYWICQGLNTRAVLRKCQSNMGFDQNVHACVPWITWVWAPCVEPPTRPVDWQPCVEIAAQPSSPN